MHSILLHGMCRSLAWLNPRNPLGRGTMIAVIFPSHTLNSKSLGHPSFAPSQRLITSFSRNSQVLNRSIKSSFPKRPKIIRYSLCEGASMIFSFSFLRYETIQRTKPRKVQQEPQLTADMAQKAWFRYQKMHRIPPRASKHQKTIPKSKALPVRIYFDKCLLLLGNFYRNTSRSPLLDVPKSWQ